MSIMPDSLRPHSETVSEVFLSGMMGGGGGGGGGGGIGGIGGGGGGIGGIGGGGEGAGEGSPRIRSFTLVAPIRQKPE